MQMNYFGCQTIVQYFAVSAICICLVASPLKNETQPSSESLIVTLTVSKTCRNAIYTLAVSFGARDSDGNYDSGKNLMMTSRNVVPGKPYSFKVNASVLELESGQVYCYNGSLLGSEGILYGEVSAVCDYIRHAW